MTQSKLQMQLEFVKVKIYFFGGHVSHLFSYYKQN